MNSPKQIPIFIIGGPDGVSSGMLTKRLAEKINRERSASPLKTTMVVPDPDGNTKVITQTRLKQAIRRNYE